MCSTIEAGKGPVGVDQANDKGDAVLGPSGIVDKVGKDKPGLLMCRRSGGNDDQNDEERDQRSIERGGRNDGEDFAIAIEEEGKGVGDLISYENVPRLDHAAGTSVDAEKLTEIQDVILQVWVRQLVATDGGTPDSQRNAGGGEDAACPRKPSGEVGREVGISSRCQFVGPEILSACVWQGTGQLR